jgi:hypothetical protein
MAQGANKHAPVGRRIVGLTVSDWGKYGVEENPIICDE